MSGFRVTGRFVLFSLIGFFLAVFIANGIFITLALESFPGEQEKKSYVQGLAYNDTLEARAEQEALGWTAELTALELEGEKAAIELTFKSASGAPISTLAVDGLLARPVDADHDRAVDFEPTGSGRYLAEVDGVAAGVWRLEATAKGQTGERFFLEKRLTIK
ncbi:FixH family protein [Hyphococcus luteus]|uniref:Nitrogen fixation protein FixH n=1 Tax=Hyphococcus luteus TaxID=2058213 RepID=A0A2S7K8U5_9PROT|nr:FixH family protein [Marinicaulis flavus]PQA88879.1 hypothetical protein CW354_02655 [Marinicaulis flavus]